MASQSLSVTFNAPSAATLTDMANYAAKGYGYQAIVNGVPNPLTPIQHITQYLHDEVVSTALTQKAMEAAAAASAAVNYNTVT